MKFRMNDFKLLRQRLNLLGFFVFGICSTLASQTIDNKKTEEQTNKELPFYELDAIEVKAKELGETEGTGLYTTPVMVTVTRMNLSVLNTPQSVSVITRQILDDNNIETLKDAVEIVTGLNTTTYDSHRFGFSARGFPILNLQIDGISTPWTGSWAAGETLTTTVIYDRIEVVRGASGLIAGAGDPSAAINMVRKRANSMEMRGHFTLSAGRWNAFGAEIDVSTPVLKNGRVRSRFVASYDESDSFVSNLHEKTSVIYGTAEVDLTENTLLSFGASLQDVDPSGSTWGGLPTWFSDGSRAYWDRSKTTAAEWTSMGSENATYFANIDHYFENEMRVHFGYFRSENRSKSDLIYLFGSLDKDTGTGLSSYVGAYKTAKNQDNIDLYATIPLEIADKSHEIIVGFIHSDQHFDAKQRLPLVAIDVGNFYDWDGSSPAPEWGDLFDNTQWVIEQTGLYAAAKISATETTHFVLGSRLTNWKTSGGGLYTADYDIKHESVFTPYAGVTYNFVKNHAVYVSYSDIFNPQDAKDRNGSYLDPVIGKNYELGVKGEYFGGLLNASLAIFKIQQDNLAQPDGDYKIPGTMDQAYYAAEGAESVGFELEISGKLQEDWMMTLGWSQFEAEDAYGIDVNTDHPRKLLKLFTTYKLAGTLEKLSIGGGINWQSKIYSSGTDPLGNVVNLEQEAYTLVSLFARYDWSKDFSMQLNVTNLLDETYYSQIGFYSQYAYGEPADVILSLRYKF